MTKNKPRKVDQRTKRDQADKPQTIDKDNLGEVSGGYIQSNSTGLQG